MYVGGTLLLAGLSVLLASDWTLVMTIVFALVVHFGVIKREERYLEAKFGEAYRAYRIECRATAGRSDRTIVQGFPNFVPLPWRGRSPIEGV